MAKFITAFSLLFLILFSTSSNLYAEDFGLKTNELRLKNKLNYGLSFQDSTKKSTSRKFSAGGMFLSIGTGLNVPMRGFSDNSNPTFGILGRLEFASTGIFPFVIGAEVSYWSYKPYDQFTTLNLLNTFRTKIVSFGLSVEYSLARLFNSPYSIPFFTLDVKTNSIKRDIDAGRTIDGLPAKDSKVSIGGGFGVTLFVLDFYIKYNYMKELSNFGVYAKMRIPIIRF